VHDNPPRLRRNSQPTIEELLQQRLTRREVLQQSTALGGLTAFGFAFDTARAATAPVSKTSFVEITSSNADRISLPPGYTHDVVIRWGDAMWSDTPSLDTSSMRAGGLLTPTAAVAQQRQFGEHCDAIQYFRLDAGHGTSRSGVLCINNEYTDDELLFPGRRPVWGTDPAHIRELVSRNPGIVHFAKAAHGVSVVEVARSTTGWTHRRDSHFNRRITADTPIEVRGPARGAAWMRTAADPTGTRVLGTLANCAGGRTPWNTYLSAEENLQDYFGNFATLHARRDVDAAMLHAHRRVRHWDSVSPHGWELVDSRFDAAVEPHEAFRFGWIVELDPMNPSRPPVKRTALGRMAHEAASPVVAANGQLAVYMGDDDLFEYIYKFVSRGRVGSGANSMTANDKLLDEGTLYVARFDADGKGEWLPLIHDPNGRLNAANGFRNQAEVLIQARAAADALGATPMDRPEDIEIDPHTGKIYIACTRNESRLGISTSREYAGRKVDFGVNAANTRPANRYGHIIEIAEVGADHSARQFRWDSLLMGPGHSPTSLGSPDNLAFDTAGRLWVVTDGTQPDGGNNGCYVCSTSGADRGNVKRFLTGPVGCEIAGCVFAPGDDTLFISIQHPGEGGTLARPISDWPDGNSSPPRSSVIAIRREDGGTIGT
jgi:secreted PhoX family phosphatase